MTGRLNSLWLRLFLGYAIPLLLFLCAALVAYVTIQRLLGALDREQLAQQVLTRAYKLKEGVASMSAYESAHHLLGDPAYETLYRTSRKDVLHELAGLRNLVDGDTGRLTELDTFADVERRWHQLANEDFKRLAGKSPRTDPDWGKWAAGLQLREEIDLQTRIRARADALVAAERERLAARRRQVQDTTAEGIWAIAAAALLAVLLSLLVSVQSARGVARPIRELREAAARLRRGEFTVVTPSGPREIAELTRAFNVMGIALTEREAMLQSSEQRYRTVVGSTSTLLWTTDAHGGNADMSFWRAFTGQSEEETRGDGWLQAVHPEDRDAFARRWAEALATRSLSEDELRLRRADGCYRTFLCRSVPVLNARGEVLEWVRCCTDVTERRRQEELRHEKEAAEAASRAKSEFLARMSHELRTPLNAVIGMSRMLATERFGPLNAKQADYLHDISSAGEHLLLLINDILDLSKVEAGRMDLYPEAFAPGAAIQAAVATVRPLAEAKGVALTAAGPEPEGGMIADPVRFKQILLNLLSNAIKFTPGGGRVTVYAQWTDRVDQGGAPPAPDAVRVLRVDVEDTGVGIDPHDHGLIGYEFYQGRRSRAQVAEGTGLGLALTRRLVDMMGGAFWFRSTPGEGSCFSFALPLQPLPTEQAPGEPAQGPTERSEGTAPVALVIEDHVPTNKLLSDWLRTAGLEVVPAFTGPVGLQQAHALRPVLIVLDIRLPGMSGWQVLTALKSRRETASIPVVLISATQSQPLPRELHVVEWFIKPLERERFLARLQAAGFLLAAPPSQDESPLLKVET